MERWLKRAVFAVAATACPLTTIAGALCPDTITVKQNAVAPAAGWAVSYSKTPSRLEAVSFYGDPPASSAALGYDTLVNAMDGSTATWQLAKSPHGHWIKCSYHGTAAELSKPLPAAVTSCEVSYGREAGSTTAQTYVKDVVCK